MAKVKLGLDKLTPEQMAAFAANIKTAMTGNASFPTPNPTLASVGTLITTLQTKIATHNAALTTVDATLADRDTATLALRGALTTLGAYVENASGGNRTTTGTKTWPARRRTRRANPYP